MSSSFVPASERLLSVQHFCNAILEIIAVDNLVVTFDIVDEEADGAGVSSGLGNFDLAMMLLQSMNEGD